MNLFLAASMRSGSTHLSNTLQRMGWRKVSCHLIHPGAYNEEPMIDIHAADFLFPDQSVMFYAHMRALGRNVPLLKEHGVHTLVLQRNLLDCIYSWKESCDLDHAAGRGDQYIYAPIYGAEWGKLDEEQKWNWILYNVVPWYLSFYQSWLAAAEKIPVHFMWYEEHFKDEEKGLERILRFMDIKAIPRRKLLTQMCNFQDGKFNVGKVGRGESLPTHYKERIKEQVLSWGPAGEKMCEELICRKL